MQSYWFAVRVDCPGDPTERGGSCGRPLWLYMDPGEPQTRDYPGTPAAWDVIEEALDCLHFTEFTDAQWQAVQDEADIAALPFYAQEAENERQMIEAELRMLAAEGHEDAQTRVRLQDWTPLLADLPF